MATVPNGMTIIGRHFLDTGQLRPGVEPSPPSARRSGAPHGRPWSGA